MNLFSNASNTPKQMRQDLTAMLGPDQCLFDLEDRWTYAFDAGADQALPETLEPLAVSLPDIQAAGQVVPMLRKSGVTPCTLEFIDRFCLDAVRKTGLSAPVASLISSNTGAMLLIELDGDPDTVAKEAVRVRQICDRCGAIGVHSAQNAAVREQL